jgi:ectoine hydroxylase-related dioxygenase (phytanoyl-CoA dioxygenase family)
VLPEVYELCTHPGLVAVMESLLGPDLILWRSQFMRKESGGNALAWHQDGSFPGGAVLPAVNPVKTISAWIAVDEARVDNGCVWVVPGTHRGTLDYVRKEASRGQGLFGRGFEVEYAVSPDRAVPMVLQPGQFMVFDCQTLHGSSHNPSPWRRLGLACRYTSPDVKVYENQTVDGQGYVLDRFGCIVVRGEDRYGHNVMAQPPKR